MDKIKQAKLLELRQKNNENKKQLDVQRHDDLLTAINSLRNALNFEQKDYTENIDVLIDKLDGLDSLEKEIAAVKQAIKEIPEINSLSINNLDELTKYQQEVDLSIVIKAIDALTVAVKSISITDVSISNRKASDFIPMRRVREVNGKLVFDDAPMQVSVVGGGGSSIGIASFKDVNGNVVQVRLTADGKVPVDIGDVTLDIGEVSIDTVGIKDTNNNAINPSTLEKQNEIIQAINGGFYMPQFDYCSQVVDTTTDTWTYKAGGVSGTVVATVVITYTDSNKNVILSVARS